MMIPGFLVPDDLSPDPTVDAFTLLPDLGVRKRLTQQDLRGLQVHFLRLPPKRGSLPMILEKVAIPRHYDSELAMDGSEFQLLPIWSGRGSQRSVLPDVF